MSEGGATAVSFTLLAAVLLWWVAFELWPELRAAKLRLRLWRLALEQKDPDLLSAIGQAARLAEEIRWLPMLIGRESGKLSPEQERVAWLLVQHAAWGAPWMWLTLISPQQRERWVRRAWSLAAERRG
ncbi:MAG: hypothetical protein WHT08_03075 [Bryobacteraceae bacterium]|jgi:hypothetical protein